MSKNQVSFKTVTQIGKDLRLLYGSKSVDILMKVLDIKEIRKLRFLCLSTSGGSSISLRAKFMLADCQIFFLEIIMSEPFFMQANFHLVSCENVLHKKALQYTKKDLGKTVTINSFVGAEEAAQDFCDHVALSMKLFEDLKKLVLRKKSNGVRNEPVRVSPQDIIFSIPPSLRCFEKSEYSFLCDRGNNFFPNNG